MTAKNDNNNPQSSLPYSLMLFKKVEEMQATPEAHDSNGVYCKGSHSRTTHTRGGGYCKKT